VIRNLVAAIVGIFVAMLTIRIVEMLGHFIYPPPANFEFGDPDQVREFIATLPVGSILFVAAAWAAGTFLGTLAGALLSTTGPLPYAVVVAASCWPAQPRCWCSSRIHTGLQRWRRSR